MLRSLLTFLVWWCSESDNETELAKADALIVESMLDPMDLPVRLLPHDIVLRN